MSPGGGELPPVPASVVAVHDVACLDPRFRAADDRAADADIAALHADWAERLRDEFVPANRPVVLRSVLADWPPVEKWHDDAYLLAAAAHDATIPARRADASAGSTAVEGAYETDELTWAALLDAHAEAAAHERTAAHYAAQLRLRTAMPRLFVDTNPVPECVGALGPVWRNAPAAYFGCGHATPLHFDQLENIFCVVRGRKRVTLWHPADAGLLYAGEGGQAAFSRANVYAPDLERFPLLARAEARGLHVELQAGDALYIPICWWHAIRTPVGERSISITYHAQQPPGKAREPDGDGEWDDSEDEGPCDGGVT